MVYIYIKSIYLSTFYLNIFINYVNYLILPHRIQTGCVKREKQTRIYKINTDKIKIFLNIYPLNPVNLRQKKVFTQSESSLGFKKKKFETFFLIYFFSVYSVPL